MAALEELRERLDQIDNQITHLYEERMKICEEVGAYKVQTGKRVLDKQRENNKLADVASKVEGEFNKKGIQELYEQLMSMSRNCKSCFSGNRRRIQPGCNAAVFWKTMQ